MTTDGLPWTDIDTDEDLLLAKEMFLTNRLRVECVEFVELLGTIMS